MHAIRTHLLSVNTHLAFLRKIKQISNTA